MRVAFQDPRDRHDGVPIPRCRPHTEPFAHLVKVANRLHVTTVHAEDKSASRSDNSDQPFPARWKCDREESPDAVGSWQDGHESNHFRARRLRSERILDLQADQIATVADQDFRLKWQLPAQFSHELCARSRFPNDKRARRPHIHDIMVTQLARENAWPKGLVSANIDTSAENDESHSGIMRASCLPCQPTLPTFPPCPGSCGSPLAQRPAR